MVSPTVEAVKSWGMLRAPSHTVYAPQWRSELDACVAAAKRPLLPCGRRRSYGDSCLNADNALIDTSRLDRFISADWTTGVVTVEPGVTIRDLLAAAAPRGWFAPVIPGTQFVTVAGAIANDIHGKNHHAAGTFGRHVMAMTLWRSDRGEVTCGPDENPELFAATVGGLGLTGLITRVTLQLKAVKSPLILARYRRADNLERLIAACMDVDTAHEYSVGWIDCVATGSRLGRGILIYGDHADAGADSGGRLARPQIPVPITLPEFTLNRYTVAAFNTAYFHRNAMKSEHLTHYNGFFFPLDGVRDWNRIYGKRGFFQYQFVIPDTATDILRQIVDEVAVSGQSSFLAVLKRFGAVPSPGILSFPAPGWTLALDFPNRGAVTESLFARLDGLVSAAGGRLYPAKDARMSAEMFRAGYPGIDRFRSQIDPGISSDFARRMGLTP